MAAPLCLYHNDADGACSAWIVQQVHPDVECVPVSYGEEPPLELAAGRLVYVVDFSYEAAQLQLLAAVAEWLLVVDHHKTGRDRLWALAYPGEPCDEKAFDIARRHVEHRRRVVFDMDHAGCGLTWRTLFPDKRPPWWVDYVEDRDLWRWKLPRSRSINAYLGSLPFGPEMFGDLPAPPLVVEAGDAILRYQRQQVETLCRGAYRGQLPRVTPHRSVAHDGFLVDLRGAFAEVPIVNTPALISEVGNALAEGEALAAVWYVRRDGTVKWSLRSVEGGADVGTIAQLYGGGGHKRAAGFSTSLQSLKDSLP